MFDTLLRRFKLLALVALYVGIAALVVGTVAAEFGDRWWVADLFAHFRYHYALCAALLALVAIAIGRRGMAAAALCLVVPQIWAVAAPPRTAAVSDAPPAARLRVMSVNVLVSNPRDDDVAAAVERADPDIVVLQEVSEDWDTTIARLARRLPHVAPTDWRNRDRRLDNVLLTRFPIVESRVVYPPDPRYSFPHVEAILLIHGRRVKVLGVHPPLPKGPTLTAMRQSHLDFYARTAAATRDPLLIVGDFNLTPYSPRFRRLLRNGGLGYVHLGWSWPATWPSESRGAYQRHVRGFPIDHILTSRHFAVVAARTLPDVGSDHYPLLADLVLR
ncbi:MAG: endonuclease/exonuclease/phosphatase family protein [Rhodospirillaceae bacterium]|nr:endonuclease/exonuclease/phosphatase family protein [Rhodospirillaceae bacterium]